MKKRIINRALIEEIRLEGCTIGNDCLGCVDVDHVTTRGGGGNDVRENLMPLCRKHHTEKGQIAFSGMIKKYPEYFKWLLKFNRDDIIERARR